jgi:hypothetical protein
MSEHHGYSDGNTMSDLNLTDTQLLHVVSNGAPASIADVVAVMQSIDGILPSNDGLKWFNKLYLMVTQQIDAQPPPDGWEDATWLTRLDVVFAGFYFTAIVAALTQGADTASSWDALFEARKRAGVDRIQFALAGMNDHINHDLALALLRVDDELHIMPALDSPEHSDYERVNGLLEDVLPSALSFLAKWGVGRIGARYGKGRAPVGNLERPRRARLGLELRRSPSQPGSVLRSRRSFFLGIPFYRTHCPRLWGF